MSTEVSIILCTRNRARDLRETLTSLGRCVVPAGWEVEALVVDNGSSDDTREVVESNVAAFREAGISLRYTLEPVAGQCRARNRGLRETTGEVILFTDDDVRVPADWVTRMSEPIRSGRADAVAGSVVIPATITLPEELRPTWVAASDDIRSDNPERSIGANMAFSRRIMEKVPGFDPELGPGAMGFHDESLFCLQYRLAGFRLAGAWDVEVEHHFDVSRMTRAGVLAMAEKLGRSDAYWTYHWWHGGPDATWRRDVKMWIKLTWRRIRRWRECFVEQRVMRWEADAVRELACRRQMWIEVRRPRNYEKQGLRKVAGVPIESGVTAGKPRVMEPVRV